MMKSLDDDFHFKLSMADLGEHQTKSTFLNQSKSYFDFPEDFCTMDRSLRQKYIVQAGNVCRDGILSTAKEKKKKKYIFHFSSISKTYKKFKS